MKAATMKLEPGESKIDTWPILYYPPAGGKYNGKLTITNKRLLFMVSAKTLLSEGLPLQWDKQERVEIKKAEITEVLLEDNLLNKKIILILTDGSTHIFNYGALNVDKVVKAIYTN